MAQRRMFSPDIVCSDAFLDMPPSTQALYYLLGMRADDDGFVNPRGAMRMLGTSEDDLKILIAKRFVLPFENGVVVVKHWRINNLVRKDWYRPTQYVEQKRTLFVKENGSYTQDSAQGTPLVNDSLTVRPRRLGKDSIDNIGVIGGQLLTSKNMRRQKEDSEHYEEPAINADTGEYKADSLSKTFGRKSYRTDLTANMVETLRDLRGLKSLDGEGNHRIAGLVASKLRKELVEAKSSATDEAVVEAFKVFLTKLFNANKFHYENATSMKYINNNWQKLLTAYDNA